MGPEKVLLIMGLLCVLKRCDCIGSPQVKLVNGPDGCSGRVEVYHEGQWGTICDHFWDLNDAQVVCRQVGCGTALTAKREAFFGEGLGKVWLGGMKCLGHEKFLDACDHSGYGGHGHCRHKMNAGVICSNKTRLVNGTDRCSGRVEVFHNDEWVRLCGNDWSSSKAVLTCSELECGNPVSPQVKSYFGESKGLRGFTNRCLGNETSIADCSLQAHPATCDNIALKCTGSPQVKLVNGPDGCSGRVEVYHEGQWGTICDDLWDLEDAQVVCRQCKGHERFLDACGHWGYGLTTCDHDEDAGVICSSINECLRDKDICGPNAYCTNLPPSYTCTCESGYTNLYLNSTHNGCIAKVVEDWDDEVSGSGSDDEAGSGYEVHAKDAGVIYKTRLVNGTDRCSGRVEVFHNDEWVKLCSNDWSSSKAVLTCRELECGNPASSQAKPYFGESKGLRGFTSKCLGNETSIADCALQAHPATCDNVALKCTGSPQVKLVNGTDGCSGRVEVYHEGQWGTICDGLWDLNDAQVVCRQVDCGTALTAKSKAFFGQGFGKIWLTDMECLGHERFLDACSHHLEYGVSYCNHRHDAGVICSSINECLRDKDICGPNAYCTNLPPSYTCTCESGYTNLYLNSTHNGCIDTDECQEDGDICGVKGTCENREGSYRCNCSAGYSNYGNERTTCSELQCDQFKADITHSSAGVSNILSLMWNSCTDLSEGKPSHGDILLEMFTAVEDLLESPGHLNNSDNSDNSDKVTRLLQAVEDAVRLIGPQLQGNYTHIETNQTEAGLAVRKGTTPPTGLIHLSIPSATLDTDWQTVIGNGTYPGFALTVLVSYKNLEKSINHSFQHLSGYQKDGVDPNYQVYSKVVSVVVSIELLDKPVILTMRHLQEEKNTSKVKFICAYWKSGPHGQEGEEGAWATDGCTQQSTNSTHTVCRSKHIKGFAVLMALYHLEELFELELLTMLGLVTSLLCLAVCIFTFRFCRSIKGTPTTIHLHLCICLFIADLIFLTGVSQTESEVGCKLVAALLHYFFLGTFCWMLLEGVLLYKMVVKVVINATIRPLYLYTVGYGTPLVIVVISAISRPMGYGTERHCWLSLEHGFIWSFIGPVFGIIALNVFFFILIVQKLIEQLSGCCGSDTLRQHRANQDHSKLHKIKVLTGQAIALLCMLGLTWVFGAFLFEDGTVAVVYIFTILNSLQGMLIFVFHCLRSKKVKEWYLKKLSICRPTTTQQEYHQGCPSPQTRDSVF